MTSALSVPVRAALVAAVALAAITPRVPSQELRAFNESIPVPMPLGLQGPAAQTQPSPQFQATHEQIADALASHHRYQEAIEEYKKVDPMTASVWNRMGVDYELMFNNAEALHCYLMAQKMEPKSAVVINNLAALQMSAKEYGGAEKLYRKAVKLDPTSALFRKNLGTAYLTDHQYKKGWEAYRAALALDPQIFTREDGARVENPSKAEDRGAMNYYMARCSMLTGNKEQAIEFLRLALNEGYTNPKKISEDAAFAALHDLPAFQALIQAQGNRAGN